MDSANILQSLVIVFFLAFAGAVLSHKLRQPIITGYLVLGMLATAFFGRWLHLENAKILADVGLAFLMFVIGLDFSFRRLSRVKGIAVIGGITQIILCTGLFFLVTQNLVMAIVFSLSSTAIVVKLLSEKGQLDTLPAEIIVGILMVQDLAVVPILVLLNQPPNPVSIIVAVAKSAFLIYLVLFLGKKLIPKILEVVSQINNREVLLIAIVGIVCLFATLTNALGLSFALGAFLAGLLVADSVSQHAIFSEIRPLRDVFAVTFFVTLGILLSPADLIANLLLIIKLVFAVIFIKFIITTAIALWFKYHLKTALQVGLSLTSVSEFAFVVGTMALSSGKITPLQYSLILAVTIVTMILAPFQQRVSVKIYDQAKDLAAKWSPRLYKSIFSGFDRYKSDHEKLEISNHIVICGHGRVGRPISRILAMAQIPFVVVDYNHKIIVDLEGSGVPTVLGDPADRDVLAFAGMKAAAAVVVAVPDRYSQELIIQNAQSLHPGITIICRSHFDEDHDRLYALGVKGVISPEFEAALSMSHRVLDSLGVDKTKTAGYLKQIRKEQL